MDIEYLPIAWASLLLANGGPWHIVPDTNLSITYRDSVVFNGSLSWLNSKIAKSSPSKSIKKGFGRYRAESIVSLEHRIHTTRIRLPLLMREFFTNVMFVEPFNFRYLTVCEPDQLFWMANREKVVVKLFEDIQASLNWYLVLSASAEEFLISTLNFGDRSSDSDVFAFEIPENPRRVIKTWRSRIGFEEFLFRVWFEETIESKLAQRAELSRVESSYLMALKRALANT